MTARGTGLQTVVLAPVLALMIVAGIGLYLLVLRTVGDYADDNVRASLESLSRGAFAIADAGVDRQNFEGNATNPKAERLYQLDTLIRFEDFAREMEVGLIVQKKTEVLFSTGIGPAESAEIKNLAPRVGDQRLNLSDGREYYVRPIAFSPWDWRILLVRDASAFEALAGEVRAIYVGSAVAVLLVTLLLVIWLRQVLVRPISGIAQDFLEGREPAYRGVRELEELSDSIGAMKRDLEARTLHLDAALDSMSDAITVFDRDLKLVAWNPQFVELYRYPKGFVREGLSFEEIMRFNTERGDYGDVDVEAHVAQLVERGRRMDPPRWEVARADGITVEIRRARMPDGGYVTTYTDITDRKRAEAARLARREAEAANKAKSDFLENISHDLRKPATGIIESARLLADGVSAVMQADDRGNLDSIQANATHLLVMIDEILEMSRIEAGEIEIRPATIRLDDIAESVLHAVQPVAEARGLALSADCPADLKIVTDPRLLSRILLNLAGNAIEYTSSGSVSIAGRRQGENIEIAVADTGVGIAPDKLGLIFEKFQQVEPLAGVVKPGMGLGLGLAISREFAHMLGGGISVESELGKGSVFTVTIPATQRRAPANGGERQ